MDTEKRRQIYWDLEKVLYDTCEDVWVLWEMWPSAYRKTVQGYDHEMIVKHKEIWELVTSALVQGRAQAISGACRPPAW